MPYKVSLRLVLTGIVLSALAPAFALVAFDRYKFAAERKAEIEQNSAQITAQIGRIVDGVIEQRAAMLRTLATSPLLKSGDLAAFHAHAKAAVEHPGGAVILTDRSLQMLLVTALPYGTDLPGHIDEATSRRAFETGRLEISDLYLTPFGKNPVIGIVLPVPETDYLLRVTLSSAALSRMLQAAALPGWTLGIMDRERRVIARSSDAETWVGRRASQSLREAAQPIIDAGKGMLSALAFDGRQSFIAYRNLASGWTTVATIDHASAQSLTHRSSLGSTGWAIAAAAGLLFAILTALYMRRSLQLLTESAEAIGMGGDPLPINSGIVEIDRVASALSSSARLRSFVEAEAVRQELLFRSVFESNPDCMILADHNRRVLRVNPAFERVFRCDSDDYKGKPTRLLYAHRADWAEIGALFEEDPRRVIAKKITFVRSDGDNFPALITTLQLVDSAGEFIAFLSIIRDVTIDSLREKALTEKRHLEALGRLSSGIAHDFNNLLTIVSGNLQLIEARTDDPKFHEPVGAAMQATEMGARLNQRLMTFARRTRFEPAVVDLNALASSALDLVRRTTGESITVDARFAAGPVPVLVDESEMENALVNLALNARDAMPDGGLLTVETSFAHVQRDDAVAASSGLSPGKYVRISVTDTGTGMSDEVKSRAFEPFFTTKEPGKGTGLGLTTIHASVTRSGGAVSIDSKPGKGTCVTILLPLHDDEEFESVPANSGGEVPPAGSGQIILLVEDNVAVRNATTELLQHLGYKVICADHGIQALEIIESGQEFDLVISDIVMPGGISGLDLEARLAKMSPWRKVLLYSGNPEADLNSPRLQSRRNRILRKPFSKRQLAAAVARALETQAPRAYVAAAVAAMAARN